MTDKAKLVTVIITVVVLITAAVAVAVLLTQGMKETSFNVNHGILTIDGVYGKTVNLKDASAALVTDKPLDVTRKNNGFAMKGVMKGAFEVSGYDGSVYLNICDAETQYIVLKDSGGSVYILGCGDASDTAELFTQIDAEIKSQSA